MNQIIKISFILTIVFLMTAPVKSADQNLEINTTVKPAISMTITGSAYSFGKINAGTVSRGSGGVIVSVTTNASNGYSLSIADRQSGSDSCLVHSGGQAIIPDFIGTVEKPLIWDDSAAEGFGFTVYSADTNRDAKWGSGTTYSHSSNKYAGIPETATVFHTSSGYKSGSDTTSIGFILGTAKEQETGSYSGRITITAAPLVD